MTASAPKSMQDSNSDLLADGKKGRQTWTKTSLRSKASAQAALVKLGVLTPSGNLSGKFK